MYFVFSLIDRVLYPIRAIGQYTSRLVPGLRGVANLSIPVQAALIAFLFLLLASAVATWMQWNIPNVVKEKAPWYIGITIAFPILLYYGVKLYLTPTRSLHPDIDSAWEAGIEALEAQGLPLRGLPLFLVVGAGSADRVAAVFKGSGLDLELDGVVKGAAPLRWYATAEAIYLCCPTLGVVPRLIETASPDGPRLRSKVSAQRPTETAGAFDQTLQPPDAYEDPEAFTAPVPVSGHVGRTIDLEDVLGDTSTKQRPHDSSSKRTGGLTAVDTRQQRERLGYLCQLLQRGRDPVCPVNGVLMLLPFQSVLLAETRTEAAVQDDLAVICNELKIRCTAIVLVTDMEREPGFLELIRRIGSSLAASARFGKGFDSRTIPTKERLEAFSQHACGAFEDWTHKLFGEKGALDKPTNGLLFATMCKVRGRFRRVLTSTLANGFGCEDPSAAANSLMFGGCYFAATGDKAGSQGFVSAVFSKLAQVEDDLEWMDAAIARDERYRIMANLALLLGIAAVVATAVAKFYP